MLAGVASVAGAYIWWGLSPLYYRLLVSVDPVEIIAHRVVWTCVPLLLIKAMGYRPRVLRLEWRKWKSVGLFALTAACIFANWLIFTWAVTNGQVLETSLGYFINPLFSVLLGVVVLGERLRWAQRIAVLLATAAVGQLIWRHGAAPWIALSLASTFGVYGLVRKHTRIDAVNGLLMEMTFGLPFGVAYLIWLGYQGTLSFGPSLPEMTALLILAGPVTLIPLVLFGAGAQRLDLSTIGFLQYLAPTLSFLVAVYALGESFDNAKITAFVIIWIALAIYSVDSALAARKPASAELAEAGSVLD
jgi:chloramphenicol-sensitive protein RarD